MQFSKLPLEEKVKRLEEGITNSYESYRYYEAIKTVQRSFDYTMDRDNINDIVGSLEELREYFYYSNINHISNGKKV